MDAKRAVRALMLAGVGLSLSGCSMMRLMKTMRATSEPNEKIVGQLFAVGGGGTASFDGDGIARITLEHRPKETVMRPAVISMDHPGDLEVTMTNNNPQAHLLMAVQGDGGMQVLDLPALKAGRMRVPLGTPGMYMFANVMGNMMGRGMMGMVVVGGEVPQEAKLDRPKQPRP